MASFEAKVAFETLYTRILAPVFKMYLFFGEQKQPFPDTIVIAILVEFVYNIICTLTTQINNSPI